MKPFFFYLLLLLTGTAFAQKNNAHIGHNRCATMQRTAAFQKKFPEGLTLQPSPNNLSARRAGPLNVSVVVHVVLPNPFIVTDADVAQAIARLNEDFGGTNADSTILPPPFAALRGRTSIQFCLAKTDPQGRISTGIQRRQSNTGSNITLDQDPIKYAAEGGLSAWDPARYLNIWVGADGSGESILGFAQFPQSGRPAEDGVFINYKVFSGNTCYTFPQFRNSRTLTHEAGHYFGLYHIWGDDDGCGGDDFRNLTNVGSSCSLPTGLFNPPGTGNTASDVGDTPNQGDATQVCPTGVLADSCSPPATGRMYQNFMDYTPDACMALFTQKQAQRMEWVAQNCRSGLFTNNACNTPVTNLLDAALTGSVNPGGVEVTGCTSRSYPSSSVCPTTITPGVRIQNAGTDPINTVRIQFTIDGAVVAITDFAVNLVTGAATVLNFSPQFFGNGVHSLQWQIVAVNGSDDAVPANNILTTTFTVVPAVPLPVQEGFESDTFPPPLWTLNNPDGDFTWQRVTPGRNSNHSAAIDNYNNDAGGTIDELISPRLQISGTDSVVVSFDLAYKNFNTAPDSLLVLISGNCGQTYRTAFRAGGAQLATAGSTTEEYNMPVENDWRTITLTLPPNFVSGTEWLVAFRNINGFGNVLYLDNIRIAKQAGRDLAANALVNFPAYTCTSQFNTSIVVRNRGRDAVTSYNAGIALNGAQKGTVTVNNTLNPGTQSTVILPALNDLVPGPNRIQVYTAEPVNASGRGDEDLSNDTLTLIVYRTGTAPAPLNESFQNGTFPPPGWAVVNPDAGLGWERSTIGNGSTGSAYVNTFNYPGLGAVDDLVTPQIGTTGADSIKLLFDVAAATFTLPNNGIPLDTLEVLATTDCGATYRSVYKKWGRQLITVPQPEQREFIPVTPNQWRRDSVDLTSFANQGNIQVLFRITNNFENNIFLDNISLSTVRLPQALKERGYLILPNPFRNNFTIRFLQTPITLQRASVHDARGSTIWERTFNGNAERSISVNLPQASTGIYFVRLYYRDRKAPVTERILKQ